MAKIFYRPYRWRGCFGVQQSNDKSGEEIMQATVWDRGKRLEGKFLQLRSSSVQLHGPQHRAHGQGGGEGGAGQASEKTVLQHLQRQGGAGRASGLLLYADQTGRSKIYLYYVFVYYVFSSFHFFICLKHLYRRLWKSVALRYVNKEGFNQEGSNQERV